MIPTLVDQSKRRAEEARRLREYAERQDAIAAEKEPDAPASAEMHRMQARYARELKRFPHADGWPKFEAWCKSQWERES